MCNTPWLQKPLCPQVPIALLGLQDAVLHMATPQASRLDINGPPRQIDYSMPVKGQTFTSVRVTLTGGQRTPALVDDRPIAVFSRTLPLDLATPGQE